MRNAAAARGDGEHLVTNVTGGTGIIVNVACGNPLDSTGNPLDRAGAGREDLFEDKDGDLHGFNGCSTDLRWSVEDEEALEFLLDGMQPDGTWQKDVVVDVTESIFHVAENPQVSLGGIRDHLAHNVLTYAPGQMTLSGVVTWAQNFAGIASGSSIRVTIQFPDGTMAATIKLTFIGNTWMAELRDVELFPDTARDSRGNLVPNLSTGSSLHNGSFGFGTGQEPLPGWETLVERMGYEVILGGNGTGRIGCTDILDRDNNIIARECREH